MSPRAITVLLYLFLMFDAAADSNETSGTFQNHIDEKQKYISKKVVDWSHRIDKELSRWIYSEDNEDILDDSENSIDEFFKSEKFIDETEKRFIRLRFFSHLQSKDSTRFDYRIRAQIPLSRTKKNISLFIDNFEKDYFDDSDNTEKAPGIGVNYFAPEYHKIKSKYSIGTRGLNPYIRARYSRVFNSGNWKVEPTQQFKYSLKDNAQEETNIYFDRKLEEYSLFRIVLHRKTQAHIDGFDYRIDFAHYYTPKKTTGLSFTQSFWGNSKYRYTIDDTTYPVTLSQRYSGISNYQTTLSWRKSIWRKWFTYEVQPAVSFHRQYYYEPNYILRLNFDFYFGNI